MTIQEGLKELKLILKRMQTNAVLINQYSSQPSNEKPIIGSDSAQSCEINAKVQANHDLAKRYLALHKAIARTNIHTFVKIDAPYDMDLSIHDLLNFKRALGSCVVNTYEHMNDNAYMRRAAQLRGDNITITRFYDEKKKQESLRQWNDFLAKINGVLETVNATTHIIGFEE